MKTNRPERSAAAEAEIAIMHAQACAAMTVHDKRTPVEKLQDALEWLAETQQRVAKAREQVRIAALAVADQLKPGQEGGTA